MTDTPAQSVRVRQNPRFKRVWMVEILTPIAGGRDKVEIVCLCGSQRGAEIEATTYGAALEAGE